MATSFDETMPEHLAYSGNLLLTDSVENLPLNAGKLLLSPTRTFAPVILEVLKSPRKNISGIVHNSGGGQKKVMHFNKSVHVIKDNLFPTPTVFKLIQQESKTPWSEMYQVFNMGTRMEIYCKAEAADEIISISKSFGVEAQIIGRCEASAQPKLTIESEFGKFEY